MERQPQIDEMVAFISNQNPTDLEILKKDNPNYINILKTGLVLGDSAGLEELKVRAAVCFKALDAIVKTCDNILPSIKSKLKNSQKMQLYGQILTTVSSASVITTLATKHTTITYIAGGFSLIGTLVPLIVDYLKKGIDSNKQLDENYFELVKMKLQAEQNSSELNFFINNNFEMEGISEVVNKSNQLCADISLRLALC